MAYMPYENTTVSERRSIADIQDMLEKTGFDQVASVSDTKSGRRAVVAIFKGGEFHFEVDIKQMEIAAIDNLSDRKRKIIKGAESNDYYADEAEEIKEGVRSKVSKVGWRIMHDQIKHICVAIKWGVITPADAFSGYLKLPNGDSVSNQVTQAIETGKLTSPSFLKLTGPMENITKKRR